MEFGKIVVAFDGSGDSVKAVESSRFLAEKFGSELVVVHVYSPPLAGYSSATGMPVIDWQGLEDAARRSAEGVLAKGIELSSSGGKKPRGELLEGPSAVQAIVDFCEAEKADLLVIGTRGMTGFKKLVLGSVSSGVVAHARCPVLVVR